MTDFLTLPFVEAAAVAAAASGIGAPGFVMAYRRASGKPDRIEREWREKREAFLAPHVRAFRDGTSAWDGSAPTRRHIAAAAWGYSPTPGRLLAWLFRAAHQAVRAGGAAAGSRSSAK